LSGCVAAIAQSIVHPRFPVWLKTTFTLDASTNILDLLSSTWIFKRALFSLSLFELRFINRAVVCKRAGFAKTNINKKLFCTFDIHLLCGALCADQQWRCSEQQRAQFRANKRNFNKCAFSIKV
jgi:hypothetical protein